jgi:ribosome-binding factor A
MGTEKEKKLTMGGLRHAQGFVQKELTRRIQMRSFPEIHFELDDSIEKAFEISNTIDKLARERKAREEKAAAETPKGEEE